MGTIQLDLSGDEKCEFISEPELHGLEYCNFNKMMGTNYPRANYFCCEDLCKNRICPAVQYSRDKANG